jgi:hypothetical protein
MDEAAGVGVGPAERARHEMQCCPHGRREQTDRTRAGPLLVNHGTVQLPLVST